MGTQSHQVARILKLSALGLSLVTACAQDTTSARAAPDAGAASQIVGRFAGGAITRDELIKESSRLPPGLREQFQSPAGQREFTRSMIDKKLLVIEARRRGFRDDPEVSRQIRELEERLLVQALLAAEEKAAGAATEKELREYFDAHKGELAEPERLKLGRVLAAAPAGATPAERARAKGRAEAWAQRVKKGEPFEKVAAEGDGAERASGGELGMVAKGDTRDPAAEAAAFGLRAGESSGAIAVSDGFAVLRVSERREARVPSFEEARAAVEGRAAPTRKRRVFDQLIAKLRQGAEVQVDVAASP